MAGMSPTQLTLRELRRRGYVAEVVEKRVPKIYVTRDLYGFIDVLAVGNGETIAVQATSYANISARVKKIEDDELAANVAAVRDAGWTILVWGWRKVKNRWVFREVDVS